MRFLIWGVVLILIGLFFHQSVFLGDFTVWSVTFDVLGVCFVVYGVLAIYRARRVHHSAEDRDGLKQ